MAMGSWSLPEDLVIEILVRLPVKSLVRFKCVCKRWSALTRNPGFIAMHINSNSSNSLVSWNDNSDGLIVGHDGYHVFPKGWFCEQPVDLTFGLETKPNIVLGPCDGIFCLYWTRPDIMEGHFRLPSIVLWNPATREVNMLPKSSFDFPSYKPVDYCMVGFGFDGKAKTYKVVKLVSFEVGDDEVNCAEVYTSSSGCWRFLQIGGNLQDVGLRSTPYSSMYTNDGVFHWSLFQTGNMAVVSFDMGEEVSRVTPLPKKFNLFPYTDDRRKFHSLALLKDSLGVICSFYEDGCTTFVLWLMKQNHKVDDDDPDSSWFRVSTWGPLPGLYSPLGFWKNNEVLIQTGC